MVSTHLRPSRPQFGSFITLREASRGLVACKGRLGDLAVFRRFGVKNDPKKTVSKCVWGCFGGVFMMFSDGVDAFWAPQTPIWVSDHLRFGVKNDPKKKVSKCVWGYFGGVFMMF